MLIGLVSGATTSLVAGYGCFLSYRMFDRGGELYGGCIGRFGRMYAVWSILMCVALILTSGATVTAAYLQESSEVRQQ